MEGLDLDINNYTVHDLETFYKLKKRTKYTVADIEQREYEIREQLLKSGHIDKRFKRDLIAFLELSKKCLVYEKCRDVEKPSSIPKNYKLDNLSNPVPDNTIASRENNLISRPDTDFVYTNNAEFLPGKINPINTRVITKCINIDTRFRDSINTTQSSDFNIQLSSRFNKVVSMELSALELPLNFYGISASNGNNFLFVGITYLDKVKCTLNETDNEMNTSIPEKLNMFKVIIIPDGNYNPNDLIETLNSVICPLDENNDMLHPEELISYVRFSLDLTSDGSGSGRVTLFSLENKDYIIDSVNLDFTRSITGEIDTIDISQKIGWNLGFLKPVYNNSTSYVGDSIIDTKNNRYIYLSVDDFNKNSNNPFVSIFNKSILNDDILARISIKGSHFNMLLDNDTSIVSEPRIYFGPVDIQRLRIRLFDEHGRILQMNNTNFSFCLTIKTMYDM